MSDVALSSLSCVMKKGEKGSGIKRTRQELLKKKEREREDEKRYLRLPTNELPYKEEPRHTVRAGTKRGRKRERGKRRNKKTWKEELREKKRKKDNEKRERERETLCGS